MARTRLDLMAQGANTGLERNEAEIELQRAEKLHRLLTTYVQEAANNAQSALAIAESEFEHVQRLAGKGFISKSELRAVQARVDQAKSHVTQLQLLMSETGDAASDGQ